MQKVTFQIIPFSFLLMLAPLISNGQTEKTVKNVTGKAYIEGQVSPEEAKEKALQKAKTNALRRAGVPEYVSTWKWQLTQQKNGDVSQSFMDAINSEMRGDIKSFEKVKTDRYKNEAGVFVYETTINATVIKYETKTDPNFNIKLDNIQDVYYQGANITFTVKPSKNCYLTVFNIAKDENLKLYPNYYEDRKLLKSGKTYSFPYGPINYKADLTEEDGNKQNNVFVFVFTKNEPMRFVHTQKEETEDGLEIQAIERQQQIWNAIHEIKPINRKVKVRQFKIFEKN